ncbi:hypothetical protein OSTOST_14832 [Ostertagia ostertagi]
MCTTGLRWKGVSFLDLLRTWDRGLLINGTVKLSGNEDVDKCKLFKDFAAQVKANGGRIDKLKVADDFALLDPCKLVMVQLFLSEQDPEIESISHFKQLIGLKVEDQVYGTSCGTMFCNEALGEECIAGKLCGCPKGQKRKDAQSPCRVASGMFVESFNLPLYVIRDGNNPLKYTPGLANPRDDRHKELVERFESGVGQSYDKTPLKNGFVSVEVNDIEEPSLRNACDSYGPPRA